MVTMILAETGMDWLAYVSLQNCNTYVTKSN